MTEGDKERLWEVAADTQAGQVWPTATDLRSLLVAVALLLNVN